MSNVAAMGFCCQRRWGGCLCYCYHQLLAFVLLLDWNSSSLVAVVRVLELNRHLWTFILLLTALKWLRIDGRIVVHGERIWKTASPAPFRNERSGGESVWLLGWANLRASLNRYHSLYITTDRRWVFSTRNGYNLVYYRPFKCHIDVVDSHEWHLSILTTPSLRILIYDSSPRCQDASHTSFFDASMGWALLASSGVECLFGNRRHRAKQVQIVRG